MSFTGKRSSRTRSRMLDLPSHRSTVSPPRSGSMTAKIWAIPSRWCASRSSFQLLAPGMPIAGTP
jgi:hypothetical protein